MNCSGIDFMLVYGLEFLRVGSPCASDPIYMFELWKRKLTGRSTCTGSQLGESGTSRVTIEKTGVKPFNLHEIAPWPDPYL